MTEAISSLSFLLTVLAGVVVLILGNFILKIYIEPLDSALKTISRAKKYLNFFGREISEPGVMSEGRIAGASESFREVASEILVLTATIRGHRFFQMLGFVPSKKDLVKAHDELIGLSNSLNDKGLGENNRQRKRKIADLLS